MAKIQLQYFKPSGKYYASGEYETSHDPKDNRHWEILRELKDRRAGGTWDGLIGPSPSFHTLVLIPYLDGTDEAHPYLIPAGME